MSKLRNISLIKIFLRISIATIASVLLLGCAKKNPSQKILQTFESKYPDAKNLEWKNYDGSWEAKYKLQGQFYTTLFDLDDSWIQTKHQIDYDNAPKVVRDIFAAKYETDDVAGVYKVQMKRKTYYEFMMKTQDENYMVTYDADGKFFERDGELSRSLE